MCVKQQHLQMFGLKLEKYAVVLGSETQLQMGELINAILQQEYC